MANATIDSLYFSLASDADNRAASAATVTRPELYEGETPVEGGVNDLRLGTSDYSWRCTTCGHQKKQCPGHMGVIESKIGIQHPLAIGETRRWLKAICHGCGALMLPTETLLARPAARRLAAAGQTGTDDNRACPACGASHPKVVKNPDDYMTFIIEPAGSPPRVLFPWDLSAIFGRVSSRTLELLGRTPSRHPAKFIVRAIPVSPVTIRPAVRSYTEAAASNHDTTWLQYLVRRNMTIPVPPPADFDSRVYLAPQQLYYDMVKGPSAPVGAPRQPTKRTIVPTGGGETQALLRRSVRKAGRLRRDLLGGQVFMISRSTITGNSHLRIDELGIPQHVAQILAIEETVHAGNRDALMRFVLNGRARYPGCGRIVKRATGRTYNVEAGSEVRLDMGDTVWRDLVTGDLIYFNREPSLEASALGVHRIVILPERPCAADDELDGANDAQFEFNVSACALYNADFDGDQMNVMPPHCYATRAEAEVLSSVTRRFISVKTGAPAIGEVQDGVVGLFGVTRNGVAMDKFHAMLMCEAAGLPEPSDFSEATPGQRFSGRDVVSRVLERTPINYTGRPKYYNNIFAPYVPYEASEITTVIRRGRHVQGIIDKSAVGPGAAGGILHLVAREHGARAALDVTFALQQVALAFSLSHGFTVALGDFYLPPRAIAGVHKMVSEIIRESELITERLLAGELVPPIGMTTHDFYEQAQRNALRTPDETLLRYVMDGIRVRSNGLWTMIMTGSKGQIHNAFHILGAIGQVEINAVRPAEDFAFRRTGPYSARFATDPIANGYVPDNYMSGVRGHGFIFAAQNSRFDLINKALSTASTGFQMRKGICALQSLVVSATRRVTRENVAVQMLYGEDGMDTREVERVDFPIAAMGDRELAAKYHFALGASAVAGARDALAAAQPLFDADFAQIGADRDMLRRAVLRLEGVNFTKPYVVGGRVRFGMPVSVARLVRDALLRKADAGAGAGAAAPCPLADLLAMRERVADLVARVPYFYLNTAREEARSPISSFLGTACALFQIQVRSELRGGILARLTPPLLEYIVDAVRSYFKRSLVEYGTAVGVLAAQAVNEPLTQYMLDSHHRSVAGGTEKTGITRPLEVFGVRPISAEKSPSMLLRVHPQFERSRADVQSVANAIELLTFGQFVTAADYLLEPNPFDAGFSEEKSMYPPLAGDLEWIRTFARYRPGMAAPNDLLNWCLAVELNRSMMILKGVTLELIVEQMRLRHPHAFVVSSSEVARHIRVRIYFRVALFKSARRITSEQRFLELVKVLCATDIRGVPGVRSARVEKLIRHCVDEDTGALVRDEGAFAVRTRGTNLFGVSLSPLIRPDLTVTSSILDTCRVLGIEAARTKIVSEVRDVLGASAPDYRHLAIYADTMTSTGDVTPIEPSGLRAREPRNVLLRGSTHDPVQTFEEATLAETTAPIYGFAAPLCMGAVPRIGSTYSDVAVDRDFVARTWKSLDRRIDDFTLD